MTGPFDILRTRLKDILKWDLPAPRWPSLVRFVKRYLRWSRGATFDVGLRYGPVVRFLRRNRRKLGSAPRILDVGCGPWGLARYIDIACVGADSVVPGPEVPSKRGRLLRVRATADALPFHDRAFEVVTSMDTLEHLQASARPAAIQEMFRVASRAVVLGFPFGSRSEAYDCSACSWERARNVVPEWRREHIVNGLPGEETDALIRAISASRRARVRVQRHENLRFLALRWKLGQFLGQSHPAYGIVMAPLYAIARHLHLGTCYRRVYFVELT